MNNLVLVEKKDGIAIYGKVGSGNRLGNFEVHTGKDLKDRPEYARLAEAEAKMNGILFARKQEEARKKEEQQKEARAQLEVKNKITLTKVNQNHN